MSFGMYLNIEVLALKIINKNIMQMTDSNHKTDEYGFEVCDERLFENNLEHGWIVVVMLINYIESLINTILRDCVQYKGEKLMKSSLEDKLEIIHMFYKKDIQILKGNNLWNIFKTVTRIRNELIHYKNNFIGDSGVGITNVVIGKTSLVEIFTKEKMNEISNNFLEFSKLLVYNLGLNINENAYLFDCDGRDNLVSYVYE